MWSGYPTGTPHHIMYLGLTSIQKHEPLHFHLMPAVIPELSLRHLGIRRYLDLAIIDHRFGAAIGIEIDGSSHYEPCDKGDEAITDEDRERAFMEHTQKDRQIRRAFQVYRFTNLEITSAVPSFSLNFPNVDGLNSLITQELPMSVRTPCGT